MTTHTLKEMPIRNKVEIASGQYWRSRADVRGGSVTIPEGTVLLLLSIRWVDDKPHTIILRPHPSMVLEGYTEHRFLFKEFVKKFAYEPNFQRIRDAEIADIQRRISSIQNEITGIGSNPAGFLPAPGAVPQEKASPGAPSPAMTAVAAMPSGLPGTSINLTPEALKAVTPDRVNAVRAVVEQQHQLATRKAEWITSKTEEMTAAIQELVPFFQERAAAALAQTEDVRAYADKLLTGVESLDLYIGKGVEVETICQGDPAPATEPLSILQRKLFVDEEVAIWTTFDDGEFDFRNADDFFKALATIPQLRDQIFASTRCILVMAWRRKNKDYGDDPLLNRILNDQNKAVWLLARNGDNIYRILSPVESHLHSNRLFPTRNEVDKVFRGVDGTNTNWEDVRYTDHLSDHEDLALHYKRFLILLCGLQDRLNLFGDFYDRGKFANFLSLKFQERHFRFVHDDDSDFMLPDEKREALDAWVKRNNSHLRSGSRVICMWGRAMSYNSAPGAVKRQWGRNEDKDYIQYSPAEDFGIMVAYKEGPDLCVDVQVSGESYVRGEGSRTRTFMAKVNLSRIDTWGISHLCLDSVKPEDIHWFIHNRKEREAYGHYLKFFKAAYKHLQEIGKHEADTRARLYQALLDGNVVAGSRSEELIDQAVMAWRATNRGAMVPVHGDPAFSKAWETLLNQVYILAGHGRDRARAAEELAAAEGRKPLRLVVTGRNKLVLYAEPLPSEREDRLFPHSWVQKITLEERKSKVSVINRSWATLLKSGVQEHVLKEWPGVEAWILNSEAPVTMGKIQEALQYVQNHFRSYLKFATRELTTEEFEGVFSMLKVESRQASGNSGYVRDPEIAVPVGVMIDSKDNVSFLCYVDAGYAALYRSGNKDQKAAIRSWYISQYKRKDRAIEEINGIEKKNFGSFKAFDIRDRHLFVHNNNARGHWVEWGDRDTTFLSTLSTGRHKKLSLNQKLAGIEKWLKSRRREEDKNAPWRGTIWLIDEVKHDEKVDIERLLK